MSVSIPCLPSQPQCTAPHSMLTPAAAVRPQLVRVPRDGTVQVSGPFLPLEGDSPSPADPHFLAHLAFSLLTLSPLFFFLSFLSHASPHLSLSHPPPSPLYLFTTPSSCTPSPLSLLLPSPLPHLSSSLPHPHLSFPHPSHVPQLTSTSFHPHISPSSHSRLSLFLFPP